MTDLPAARPATESPPPEGWDPLPKPPSRARRLLDGIVWDAPFPRLAVCHLFSVTGETLVVLSLAGSFFFKVDPSQGREKVILGLLFTIAPFALVGPFIGPMIDRVKGGHRAVIIGTMVLRAFVALSMILAVINDSIALFPGAFAMLVLAKTYQIARAAVVPSTVAGDQELVEANSKLQLLSGLAAIAGGAVGGFLLLFGPAAVLGATMLVFVGATFAAVRVRPVVVTPKVVTPMVVVPQPDDTAVMGQVGLFDVDVDGVDPDRTAVMPLAPTVEPDISIDADAPPMAVAAFSMAILRMIVGFVTFLLAFELRGAADKASPLDSAVRTVLEVHKRLSVRTVIPEADGPPPTWYFGVVLGASVIGGLVGAAAAPPLRRAVAEERMLLGSCGVAVLSGVAGAMLSGLVGYVLLAGGIAVSAALGKQAFDAVAQRDTPEVDRGRVFSGFEARFQMTWVAGALVPAIVTVPIGLGSVLIAIAGAVALAVMVTGRRPPMPKRPEQLQRRKRPPGRRTVPHG